MSEHAAPVQATPTPAPQVQATNGFKLQRKCACGSYGSGGGSCDKCRADGKKLQRTAIGPETPDGLPESVHEVLSSSGHPLDETTRSWLEPRFNYDFSGVRVHTDAHAARSAKEVNALAYTVGRDVVFGTGQYAPGTERGTRLLAHELTHVVQQTSSGASAQQTSKAVSEPGDAAEVEADAMADRVMSGKSVNVTQAPNATLHALSDVETGLLAGGLAVAGIGGTLLTLWLSGAFDAENYSAQELTAYLTVLATTRRIEDSRNSDNKARDVVRHWRAGEAGFNLDDGFSVRGGSLTGIELKRLLIREMLSGVTAGGDEEAILTILDNTSTPDLIQLLDPTQGLSVQDIDRKVDGENHERFNQLLERRLPRTGPNAAPQRQGTGQTCTARQSLMLDYARRRAVEEVQNAIDVLTNNIAGAAVQRALACRFPGANATQIDDIRGVYERTLAKLPRRIYHCAPEGGEAEMGGLVVTDSTGAQVRIDCLGEYARTYGTNVGSSAQSTIDEVFLCPEFFRQSPDGQVLTVIHESVHAAGLLEDPNYTPPCGIPLSTALINPDSYAFLAHELMSITRRAAAAATQQTDQSIQRKAESEEHPDELPEIVDDVLDSPGQPLDSSTRAAMEPRFNRDFGDVRVHTDSTAAQSARAVKAHAYTVGQDVVFGSGQYQPQTEEGAHLLAHELTHVVQQSSSGPMTAQSSKAISDSSDAAEVEADTVATQVISGDEIVQVNQSPSASLHALSDSETGWLVAGGIVAGGAAAGLIVAAAIGAFDSSRFRNCSPDQQGVLNTATETARSWINNAVSVVDQVIANPQQTASYVVEQLNYHFKISPTDAENLGRLRQGLSQIQAGFGQLMYECDSSCDQTADSAVAARVPGLLGGITLRYGRIHVCPRFFSGPENPENRRADEQPETIAHEMAHRFVGARGDVYRWSNMREYSRLTTDQALNNADSYAQFARLVFNIGSREASSETPARSESTPAASTGARAQRKAIGSGRTLQRRARRQLQRQPAPEEQETPAPVTEPAPEAQAEEYQPVQFGGIPQLDPTSGMKGHPLQDCPENLWAREYERIFRLDTISVVGLSARPASEKPEDVKAAELRNEEFKAGLRESCLGFENVKHPFRVRVYYLDTDVRNALGAQVNSEDAKANFELGTRLGAGRATRFRIYLERDVEARGDFTDAKTLNDKLKEIIDYASQSSTWRGTKTGLLYGLVPALGTGIGVGLSVLAGGGGLGAILGFGALAAGGVLTVAAGLGALLGFVAGTDRGTKELSKERIKEVKAFVALLKTTGAIKGDKLTSSDADDLARDAVTLWIDDPVQLPLAVNDRRLLIRAMMDGPTLDDDERAIIRLIENCTDAEILQLLDPMADEKSRVTVQMLDDEIDGEEWKQTRQMLQARFPTLGAPEIQRTRTADEPACAGDHAIMLLAARKRAIEVVPIALQRVNDFLADPAQHPDVREKIQCYFPLARNPQVQQIKTMLERIQQVIPSSRHVCVGEDPIQLRTPAGVKPEECPSNSAGFTKPWVEPDGTFKALETTYICPKFFEDEPYSQATTVIHEWVHRVIPESEVDIYQPKCGEVDVATALVNSESYALLAMGLAEGRAAVNAGGQPTVSIGNFRNRGAVSPENRCEICPQIPSLGVNPAEGNNFMELRGDISGHRPDAAYDFKRTKEVAKWMRIQGSWEKVDYSPPGSLDDSAWADEDVEPKNDRIYSIDGPGLHRPIPVAVPPEVEGGVYKGNFVESANVKVGNGPWTQSSNLFEWHSLATFERGADGILRRAPAGNEIEPGHVPIGPAPPG